MSCKIAEAFAELLLHVHEAVGLDAARQRHRQRRHEFAFGQPAHRRLMPRCGVAAPCARTSYWPIRHCVQEHAVPRHQHVIENRHGVGLLKAGAERMIPLRLVAGIERLATDETQALGVGRNAEGERVFLLAERTENGSG